MVSGNYKRTFERDGVLELTLGRHGRSITQGKKGTSFNTSERVRGVFLSLKLTKNEGVYQKQTPGFSHLLETLGTHKETWTGSKNTNGCRFGQME